MDNDVNILNGNHKIIDFFLQIIILIMVSRKKNIQKKLLLVQAITGSILKIFYC